MDGAPHTDDLNLDAVNSRIDLADRLKQVHVRADRPPLRRLEEKTRLSKAPLSKTVVSEMLRGTRFPRKSVMIAFLMACGVPLDTLDPWERAWERIASIEHLITRTSVQSPPSRHGQGDIGQFPQPIQETTSATQSSSSYLVKDAENPAHGPESPSFGFRSEGTQDADQPKNYSLVDQEMQSPVIRQPVWHFPDRTQITLVSYRLPADQRPPSSDPDNQNYVRYADLADSDTIIDIYGAVRAYNPKSRVVIKAAQDLSQQDVATHLVLIGGLTWQAVTPWFSRIFSIPIEAGDPFDRGAIVVRKPDGGEREFPYTISGDEVIEDIGFFASGKNPSAPRRILIICGGITTRGVRGAALCFIDHEAQERNEQYLASKFPDGSTYCIVMRVPIINKDPLPSDLTKKENRLFEWSDSIGEDN